MSYGQNMPAGFQAIRTLGASTWNGQINPYYIKSGYPNNIYKGDPVIVAGSAARAGLGANYIGYLISLYDAGAVAAFPAPSFYNTCPMVGIFNGCSVLTPTVNPGDLTATQRSVWVANTVTLNNVPAVAYVIDDPNTVFDIQTSLGANPAASTQGIEVTDIGSTLSVLFSVTNNVVQGNNLLQVSNVSLTNNLTAIPLRGANTHLNNTLVVGIVPTPPNPVGNVPYNNAQVLIMNHAYVQRPDTLA